MSIQEIINVIIKAGIKRIQIAEILNVHRSTITRWASGARTKVSHDNYTAIKNLYKKVKR